MSDIHYHQKQILPPYKNQILSLVTTGSYGAPLFGGDIGVSIARQYVVPEEANGYITLDELNSFVDQVNAILRDVPAVNSSAFGTSLVPPEPSCFPFGAFLLFSRVNRSILDAHRSFDQMRAQVEAINQNEVRIRQLLEKVNPGMKNCHWERTQAGVSPTHSDLIGPILVLIHH
jgi:hypothetical protein